jgi:hypothetical protein
VRENHSEPAGGLVDKGETTLIAADHLPNFLEHGTRMQVFGGFRSCWFSIPGEETLQNSWLPHILASWAMIDIGNKHSRRIQDRTSIAVASDHSSGSVWWVRHHLQDGSRMDDPDSGSRCFS